jgi:hypothetical protein
MSYPRLVCQYLKTILKRNEDNYFEFFPNRLLGYLNKLIILVNAARHQRN